MKIGPARTLLPLAVALLATGCDPKLTGPDDEGGNNTGGEETPATVTPEAAAVGNILALHADLLRAGLSLAAEFDSAAAPGASPRGVLASGCLTLAELDAVLPRWSVSLEGCTDGHGTTYRGAGEFSPITGLDGYAFLPWYDVDLIRASNDANDDFNHDVHSGSFEFGFTRTGGAVDGVAIGKFVRHNVRNEVVTFTTVEMTYTGTPGSFGEYPDTGSTMRVVWDAVGIFDVTYESTGSASYTMQGATYIVNLGTGDVTVAN